ncbi:MAG TPA: hypothetical protein VFC74_10885 [Oscillospiraceae bacterium]|nr:hypothetical protein [Oscillospiraceae bacterium]
MKIGFTRKGLTLDSKPFNPLDFSVNGYGIESTDEPMQFDAFEILEKLAGARGEGVTREEQVKVLQSIIPK